MNIVFKDKNLEKIFKEDGFVILKDAVSFDFKTSYNYFNELQSNVNGKFYASLWSNDRKYRENVDNEIKKRLSIISEKYLENYESFFGDLLVKKPSLNHKFDWHQDWTFVDEEKYSSVYIWCPLQDVSKTNGCLMVIPGSHLYYNNIRGSNIKPVYNITDIETLAKEKKQYLSINKGDVIIFNQSLFHASPPNRTFKNRLAIGLLCLPKNVDIFHYHFNNEQQKIEKYKIDYDFIMNFSNEQNFIKNLYSLNLQKPKGAILLDI